MAASLLQQLDGSLDQLFLCWNLYTTGIVLALVAYLFSPLFFTSEPDTHPLLLARQAAPSAVRQSGESAVYRSLEAPHGYPLRTGLDVKDAGTPKWSAGRDGDLRDIWNEASRTRELPPAEPSRILSIKGRNKPATHELASLSREINIIGKHVLAQGGTRIAIYLPNSVELVTTLFGRVPTAAPVHRQLLMFHSCRLLWLRPHPDSAKPTSRTARLNLARNSGRCHCRIGRRFVT